MLLPSRVLGKSFISKDVRVKLHNERSIDLCRSSSLLNSSKYHRYPTHILTFYGSRPDTYIIVEPTTPTLTLALNRVEV